MKMKINFLSRVLCFVLALVMVLPLFPSGLISIDIHAASNADIGVFYTNPEGWGTVYGYIWYTGGDNTWPGQKLSVDPETGYYFFDLSSYKGKDASIIFSNGTDMQTADLKLPKLASGARYYVSSRDRYTDEKASYRHYAPGEGPRVVVHFNATAAGWSNAYGYAWYNQNGESPVLTLEYPGRTLEENSGNKGWYDLVLYDLPVDDINVIFSSGSNKTGDLSVTTAAGEYWVSSGSAAPTTTAPSGWNSTSSSYSVTLHYYDSENWGAVRNYVWDNNGKSDYCAYWPGRQIAENPDHMNWYDLMLEGIQTKYIHCIFNNGTSGDGNQTANIDIDISKYANSSGHAELWYYNGSLLTSAPSQWNNTYSASKKFYIPGTLPGKQWDAGSNAMNYTGSNGIYQYTFQNVPAGTYEFKIAANGTWDENYGYGGLAYGDNYSVTLTKTQDLTIWYSDLSHLAVTSQDYDAGMTVTLSGTGVPSTRLLDKRLTGIFSATLSLPAGTYNDLKLTAGGKEYKFTQLTLQQPTAITFFLNPASDLYYHNAGSGKPIDSSKVYFTTKDTQFKSIMGAVPNTSETTFRIRTGTDVRSVEMVIGRGAEILMSTAMKAGKAASDGTVMWSCNPNFSKWALGDNYWYYFVLRNDAGDVKVYSDDYGDWGTGKLVSPGQEWSYNLVIYKNGFKTPDWLKNAVIYQIFPDRFFNGDQGNDRAQLFARGNVYYEFPGWYMLPENPSVRDNPQYPSNAFKGDRQYSNEIYGGDLKGITQKIGYLKALGVTVIYLNPVFHSISNHRYDACDYTKIDPILGTLGDFEELVKVAEANGMHIVLDGVFNHVSDDSIYFDRYYKFLGKSEKIGAYPYWAYVYDLINGYIPSSTKHTLASAQEAAKKYFKNKYGITDFSYTEWFKIDNIECDYTDKWYDQSERPIGKPVYAYEGWWGYDSMPVIYSTNGSEYQTGNWAEEIIGNDDGTSVTQYWIAKGNDGWRLDVANEVSDETWQHFRESVKAMNSKNVTVLSDGSTTYDDADDAAIIGEIWADAAYYLLGDMYDSVMNYLFRDAAAGFARTYRINRDNKEYNLDDDYTALDALNTLESTRERYPQEAFYAMMNLVGSHDTARILSYLDDVEDDGWGNSDINKAYPSYAGTSTEAKKLQYMVALIQFTYAGAPTIYYGDEIGMVGSDDPDDRRAFEWGKGQKDLVEWYALLAQIRSQYSALRTGSVEPFAPSSDVMGYVRRDSKDTFVILANRRSTDQSVRLNLQELNLADVTVLTDLLSGNQVTANAGMVTVQVPAYSGVILKTGTAAKVTLSTASAAALRPAWTTTTEVTPATWKITYSWDFSPPGVTLPAGATVENDSKYTVDTTYPAGFTVYKLDSKGEKIGQWVFSGWSNTGTLTVTGDVSLTGTWSYEKINAGTQQPTVPVIPPATTKPPQLTPPATTKPSQVTPPVTTMPSQVTTPETTNPSQVTPPATTKPSQVTPPVTTKPAQTQRPAVTVPSTVDPTDAPAPTQGIQPPETTSPAVAPPATNAPTQGGEPTQTTTEPAQTNPGETGDPEKLQITIRVQVPEGWDTPYIWAWDNAGNNAFDAWPGQPLTKGDDGWWYVTIPAWVDSIIINANNGSIQTDDLVLEQKNVDVEVTVSLVANDSVSATLQYGTPSVDDETTVPTVPPTTDAPEPATDPVSTTTEPENTTAQPESVPTTQQPAENEDNTFPWWGVLLILLGLAAAGAGGWFGYQYYRKKKNQ